MRAVSAVLALAAVLASGSTLAGCSTGSGQTADADAASRSSARAPDDPIPPVRTPKDLAAIQPCLLLTPAQLEADRIDQPGRPRDVLGNTGCEWSDTAHTREFAVFVDLGNDVLRNVYSQRDTIPVLEVTQVAGQPAIRTKDDVHGASCYFRVAAADAQTLIVRFTALRQNREDPCGPAKSFAETVIGNLPPLKG
ncbi:MAG: DUF3558 domain-containing protein [Pseudonocardiales bacterium]|nr:DUF3558 domain-containing protein [Pseudonocardiales bacterium]MBV9029032.1 DUF3558 domain-containing protein [Pseudonocardiales bacterium]MBW0011212.1 DUF3558 domain-containing protein [Pseudonocardiales bacterium]